MANTDPTLLIELWLIGNVTDPVSGGWDFIGIVDNEPDAVSACQDIMYFVAPVRIGELYEGKDHSDWPGAYFPQQLPTE